MLDQCTCLVSYFTIPHANLALAEGIINKTIVVAAETEESLEYSLNGDLAFLFKMNNAEEFVKAVKMSLMQYDSMKRNLEEHSYIVQDMFDKEQNVNVLQGVYETLLPK